MNLRDRKLAHARDLVLAKLVPMVPWAVVRAGTVGVPFIYLSFGRRIVGTNVYSETYVRSLPGSRYLVWDGRRGARVFEHVTPERIVCDQTGTPRFANQRQCVHSERITSGGGANYATRISRRLHDIAEEMVRPFDPVAKLLEGEKVETMQDDRRLDAVA